MINNPITIYTPPGIGDSLWSIMLTKSNTNRPINVKSLYRETPPHSRCLEILSGINNITSSNRFKTYPDFQKICRIDEKKYLNLDNFDDINTLYLDLNYHLEKGIRIDKIFPNLKFNWELDWNISEHNFNSSNSFLTKNKYNILVYTSNMFQNENTEYKKDHNYFSKWNETKWIEIFENFKNIQDTQIIWVGANCDQDLRIYLEENKLHNFIHFTEPDFGFVLSLIKNVDCMLSFQSGLSVISVLEGTPTYMMYYGLLHDLKYSWCPEYSIHNNIKYNPVNFDDLTISSLTDWILNVFNKSKKGEITI